MLQKIKLFVIDFLPKILRMKKPTSISTTKIKKDSESKLYLTEATSELSVKYLKNEYDNSSNMLTSNKNEFFVLKYNLESILNELRSMTQRLKDGDEEEEQSLNWKFAAMVIDKCCMYFFALATFISTALILFSSPNLYRSSDPDPIF
jgi:hypothetical protein